MRLAPLQIVHHDYTPAANEPDFYREIATVEWNCEDWTTKIV